MSSCSDGLCGTGTGNFPKPGDPSFNSVLSATPAFGGIQLKWTYPETNPHAVAHVNIYRSTAGDYATAVLHRVETGDSYFDPTSTSTPIQYYYWIQIVSVNGTEGEVIGPATAMARPTIDDLILGLSGQINSGSLANSLKTEIARIESLNNGLLSETEARLNDYTAVSAALGSLQDEVDGVGTLIAEETNARETADAAQVKQINLLAVKAGDNAALISQEQQLRADADSAMAESIQYVEAQLGDDLASVSQKFSTYAEAVGSLEAEYSVKVSTNVDGETIVGGFGLVNDGATVEAGFDVDRFWIGKLGSRRYPFIIDGGQVYINEAVIKDLTIDKLKTSDGSTAVKAASYDRLGNMVNPPKLKAEYLDVENLVATQAKSPNYVAGSKGWKIDKDGTAEFNTADFRGKINFANLEVTGKPLSERYPISSGITGPKVVSVKPSLGSGIVWSNWDTLYSGEISLTNGTGTANGGLSLFSEVNVSIKYFRTSFQEFIEGGGTLFIGNSAYRCVVELLIQAEENGKWVTVGQENRTFVDESRTYPWGWVTVNESVRVAGSGNVFYGSGNTVAKARVIARTGISGYIVNGSGPSTGVNNETRTAITGGSVSGNFIYYRI